MLNMVESTLRQLGGDWKKLNTEQIRSRFPAFRFDDGMIGLVDEESGIIRADKCLRAFQVPHTLT